MSEFNPFIPYVAKSQLHLMLHHLEQKNMNIFFKQCAVKSTYNRNCTMKFSKNAKPQKVYSNHQINCYCFWDLINQGFRKWSNIMCKCQLNEEVWKHKNQIHFANLIKGLTQENKQFLLKLGALWSCTAVSSICFTTDRIKSVLHTNLNIFIYVTDTGVHSRTSAWPVSW